ncbi:MAG: ATP-binding protein [Leptospiraceae bacterium]|nr:ATP-binding protein [Leptospiraceae bacterium]
MKGNRYFNTSGPNIPSEHYTLDRLDLIAKGKDLVYKNRYFTIWSPRQTGKSTYFRFLAKELEKEDYKVAYVNLENYKTATELELFHSFALYFLEFWKIELKANSFVGLTNELLSIRDKKFVLICDEIEGLNPDLFNQFLHTIRNLYHTRDSHCLKSVILVGVSNITGIIQDNASPFNIADDLVVPYFTNEETKELLGQHETETGQLFEDRVKAKISEITANQPGLVNGFARQLVEKNINKEKIDYKDYLRVEDWYLTEAIDKNIANILKIASKHRKFVESLLFMEKDIPFEIDRPSIKVLYANGLLKKGKDGNVEFWVPLYRKRLYKALYPYTNGESVRIAKNMLSESYLTDTGKINFDKLMNSYKHHIQLRGFRPYRVKDKKGRFKSIPEAAMIYSFETFISIFLQEIEGKSYREAYVSLGNTDMIINVKGHEYLIEAKKYYSPSHFQKGKIQLSYYCQRACIKEGIYLIFVDNTVNVEFVKESEETINEIKIKTYLIWYDEEKEFGTL